MNEKQHAVRTILLLDRTIRNEEVELARRTATAHATRCWSAPWMAQRKPTAVVATLNDTYITLKYGACAILEYSVCNDSDQYVSIIVVCVCVFPVQRYERDDAGPSHRPSQRHHANQPASHCSSSLPSLSSSNASSAAPGQ